IKSINVYRKVNSKARSQWRKTESANGFYLFFFQAEDGIRDKLVTGVQTCALPISAAETRAALAAVRGTLRHPYPRGWLGEALTRSEERRVGKECRSRWST